MSSFCDLSLTSPVRLTLNAHHALTERLPALSTDAIQQLGGHQHRFVHERQRSLCHLLEASYARRYPHARFPEADAFERDYLRRGFHAKDAAERFLPPFFEFPEGQQGYSRTEHLTKPYWLRPDVWTAIDATMREGSGAEDATLDRHDGTSPVLFSALHENGIPEGLHGTLYVPKVLALSPPAVDAALLHLEERVARGEGDAPLDPEKGTGRLPVRAGVAILCTVREWTSAVGGLPNLYRLESTGRLGGIGTVHVVGLPRALRRLLFAGSGLVDYDLRACNWTLARSVAHAAGLDTPAMDAYLADRGEWHQRWATRTGVVTPAAFKPVALSWLTGGQLTGFAKTTAARTLSPKVVRQLRQDPDAQRLSTEARRITQLLTEVALRRESDGRGAVWVNAVGATLPIPARRSSGTLGKEAAHALSGLEQWTIRRVCRDVRGLAGIIYDGFLAPAQATEPWESAVAQESPEAVGFTLRVSFTAARF